MKQLTINSEYPKGIIEEIDEMPINNEQQIQSLKSQLAETDYKAIKYAEGWITEAEYAPIKAERQAIRDKINELGG